MLYENKEGHKSVFGIFKNRQEVEATIEDLMTEGFQKEDISILIPLTKKTSQALEKPETTEKHLKEEVIAGGILGTLVSLSVILIPGVGPFAAAGPIVAAIGGATVLGAVSGMIGSLITKALVGYGIPEQQVIKYIDVVHAGGHLLSVHVSDADKAYKALEILEAHDAQDVSLQKDQIEKSKWKSEDINLENPEH